jgi:hypothetical protein
MGTIKYKLNDNNFGYFIVNTETNTIIDLDENSDEYREYLDWVSQENVVGTWNNEV